MIRNAKDLSPDQKLAIESLLGRAVSENEQISVSAVTLPGWLKEWWESAKQQGLDHLTMDEIDAEIAAARRERLKVGSPPASDPGSS
jgi:hypothetical protein